MCYNSVWRYDDMDPGLRRWLTEKANRKWIEKQAVEFKKKDPKEKNRLLIKGMMNRLKHYAATGDWVVIPAYRLNRSPEENMREEWHLVEKIKKLGYNCLPVMTWWDGIDRGLFIPKMDQYEAETLVGEFGLSCWVSGNIGMWFYIIGDSSTIAGTGKKLRIIDIDHRFYRYAKIQEKKAELTALLNNINEKDQITDCQMKQTVIGIMRELEDLKKVENSDWH